MVLPQPGILSWSWWRLSPKLRGKRFAGREEKKTYIRKYEKYYKQIILLKKSLLRCTCAASVQPYFFPPILSPEYFGQYKCGKWQWGITTIMLFYVAVRLLFYAFSSILFRNTPSFWNDPLASEWKQSFRDLSKSMGGWALCKGWVVLFSATLGGGSTFYYIDRR